MRGPRSTTLAALAVLVATSTALAACGGGNPAQSSPTSPTTQATTQQAAGVARVCAARDRLATTVQTVVSDLQAGNVSAARGALPQAEAAANDLKDATDQLQAAEGAKLSPQVETLKTQIQQAIDASSPAALRTALTQAATTATALATTLGADLQCPSPSP